MVDVAHALSLKCRFGGHCLKFYSVAQHSVLVSYVVAQMGGDARAQLVGLLYDGGEAYLPDVAAPIKSAAYFSIHQGAHEWDHPSFADVEELIMEAVYSSLGLPLTFESERVLVTRADLVMLMTEARDLMAKPPQEWKIKAEYLAETVVPMGPGEARTLFLGRFHALMARMEHDARRGAENAEKTL